MVDKNHVDDGELIYVDDVNDDGYSIMTLMLKDTMMTIIMKTH